MIKCVVTSIVYCLALQGCAGIPNQAAVHCQPPLERVRSDHSHTEFWLVPSDVPKGGVDSLLQAKEMAYWGLAGRIPLSSELVFAAIDTLHSRLVTSPSSPAFLCRVKILGYCSKEEQIIIYAFGTPEANRNGGCALSPSDYMCTSIPLYGIDNLYIVNTNVVCSNVVEP